MSETAGESNSFDNPSLINEIVEFCQLKAEKTSLLKTNKYYIEKVSELELQISELKAQLMGKDYEIKNLTERLKKSLDSSYKSQSFNESFLSPLKTSETLPADLDSEEKMKKECKRLKLQLESEKKNNEIFENQLKALGNNILVSPDSKRQAYLKENLAKLSREVENLTEENNILRQKLQIFDPNDVSTRNKSICSDLKISSMELDSFWSISPANSTPRTEAQIPRIHDFQSDFSKFLGKTMNESSFVSPFKIKNPEPPKTRSNFEYPKKALANGRPVKYIKCTLAEILNSPSKQKQVAEFCPNSMRRVRNPST